MNSNDHIEYASKEEINSIPHLFFTPKKPESHIFNREKYSKYGYKALNENGKNIFSINNESEVVKKDDLNFISPCPETTDILNKFSLKEIERTISGPFNNFLFQSPLSFENYLNSYNREDENMGFLLKKKKFNQNYPNRNDHVSIFLESYNFLNSNGKISDSSKEYLKQAPIMNSNLNLDKLSNYKNNLEKNKNNNNNPIDNYKKNPSDLYNLCALGDEITVSSFSNYEKSSMICFSNNKLSKNLTKCLEKEFSLDLSEPNVSYCEEKAFLDYSNLFLEQENHIINLNFEKEETRLENFADIEKINKAFSNLIQEDKKVKTKNKRNKKLKFKIEEFYVNNTENKIHNKISDTNIPAETKMGNSPAALGKNNNISYLDDCISTAFNSQKKSKSSHSRIRKTYSQIIILEEMYRKNLLITKELILQASIKTGLSFSIIYKWLWEKNNKIIEKFQNQKSFKIFENSDNDSHSTKIKLRHNNDYNNKIIFKVVSNCKKIFT